MEAVTNISKQSEDTRRLTSSKKKFRHHFLREARRMRKSRMDYYSEPDLFDYAREDAAVMEEFFNWLERRPPEIEKIQKACVYYILHADADTGEKESLGDELNRLTAFHATLADSRQMISEKAFYYAGLVEELDAVKKYRECKAAAV